MSAMFVLGNLAKSVGLCRILGACMRMCSAQYMQVYIHECMYQRQFQRELAENDAFCINGRSGKQRCRY